MSRKSNDAAGIMLLLMGAGAFLWSLFRYPVATVVAINVAAAVFFPDKLPPVLVISLILGAVFYLVKKPDKKSEQKNAGSGHKTEYRTNTTDPGGKASVVDSYDWKKLYYRLDALEREVKGLGFSGRATAGFAFDKFFTTWGLPAGSLTLEQTDSLLSEGVLKEPHGTDLLSLEPPKFPKLPVVPDGIPSDAYHTQTAFRFATLQKNLESKKEEITLAYESELSECGRIKEAFEKDEPEAVKEVFSISLARHPLPDLLRRDSQIEIDLSNRMVLCTIKVPDLKNIPIMKKRSGSKSGNWHPVSATEKRKISEGIVCSLCIRAAYLIAISDTNNRFDTIAINARQEWFDVATGASKEGIVASVQSAKLELEGLSLSNVDPKACFRHLKGITTPSFENISAIRPIFVMDTSDQRIIENKDIDALSAPEANLAAMPWEDFEHLVRQLFEWEFGKNGIEVKVTRASRDRGVDAIMYDPDPIRGGKYVLQAKRYTRLVDVAAVRDLYGTIMNEGANRGILVTTSSYGPDSYEFAKDKPISLVDGPNLIAMLQKHGKKYRLDLEEARRLEAEK